MPILRPVLSRRKHRCLFCALLPLLACGQFVLPAARAQINYNVQSSALTSSGTASGQILDGTTVIGTWNLTGFTYRYGPGTGATPTITTSAFTTAQETNYSYGVPGIGIAMTGATSTDGVSEFGYSFSASLSGAYQGTYAIDGVTLLGRNPAITAYTGPNSAGSGTYPDGDLTFSGFTGNATLSDPKDNLVAIDGLSFTSGTDIGGYNRGDSGYDWTPANLRWKASTASGNGMTFLADYGTNRHSTNEGSAFTFNIVNLPVPEPSTWATLVLGTVSAGWYGVRRRRA